MPHNEITRTDLLAVCAELQELTWRLIALQRLFVVLCEKCDHKDEITITDGVICL